MRQVFGGGENGLISLLVKNHQNQIKSKSAQTKEKTVFVSLMHIMERWAYYDEWFGY